MRVIDNFDRGGAESARYRVGVGAAPAFASAIPLATPSLQLHLMEWM
jgi:hypothetical protein